jgi:prophage regulatory protein
MVPSVPGLSALTPSLSVMSPDDLLGFSEVMEVLGVSRTSAARYTNRADFPAPVEVLARGRVWRRRDVDRWAKKNLPLPPGRPPKS